jgi:hydrogenase nickel incorporation protein HypA/HybF
VLKEVLIEVGQLEHLDGDLMRSAWSALTAGTELAEAMLSVTRIPVRVRCKSCGHEHEPPEVVLLLCPSCGAGRPEVQEGSGVLLRSIEVDQPVEVEAL